MNTRLFGILCMIGSLLAILGFIVEAPKALDGVTASDYLGLVGVMMMAWMIGCAVAVIAMISLNVVGKGTVSRFLAFLPVIAVALLFIGNTYHYLSGVDPNTNESPLIAMGWMLYMVGTLLLSIVTIAAKTWTGWRRFAPLACFLLILITPMLGDLVGSIWYVAWLPHLPWITVGYAVMTTENNPSMQPVPA
ncbi:MAG: hypothetical protein P8X95_08430 [Anaerolineales bacterium]|jgi:hypothetical protein